MIRQLAFGAALLLATGCGSKVPGFAAFTTSGLALKAVGAQFEAASNVYKQGCDAAQIKKADCEAFRAFGARFKQVYPVTVDLWDAAQKAGDTATEHATRDKILELSTELTRLAVQAYSTFGGK